MEFEKSLDASLLFSIITLASQIKLRSDIVYNKLAGITMQQYAILLRLAGDPNIPFTNSANPGEGIYASELADSLKISRPASSKILKVLMRKGLIEQIEEANDRRKKRWVLSPEGEGLLTALEPVRKKGNALFLEQFSDEEKRQLMNFIERCWTIAKERLENPEVSMDIYEKYLPDLIKWTSALARKR